MPPSNADPPGLSFAIAGAGISGLAAAIALRQSGHRATVFEKAPGFRDAGAGIGITPNGVSILDALGVGGEVREHGVRLTRTELRDSSGTLLAQLDLGRAEEMTGKPTLTIHRTDLHRALTVALPAQTVRTGSEARDVRDDGEHMALTLADGTELAADALIGADGLHSRVREALHGKEAPRYAGYVAWRGVCDMPWPGIEHSFALEIWARHARFGASPVSGGRTYWWLAANTRSTNLPADSSEGIKAVAARLCADWKGPAVAMVNATRANTILWRPIYDRPAPVKWGRGLITLIGDAAHPTTPNLAQGASMGLEDAVTLADACRGAGSPDEVQRAFRQFEQQRTERVARVVRMSWRFGRVSQWGWPPAAWLRNALVRLTPDRLVLRQFVSLVRPGLR
jgi:2-polyprenyl-6-methoxyphenol hydroxylase-like FAD-dependent oxidoreductase